MATEQTRTPLCKGDLFLVDFGHREAAYIKDEYLQYRGFWMEIQSAKPDNYYCKAVCREKHNRHLAGRANFSWDSGSDLNWRQGPDFTRIRKVQHTPEALIVSRQTLPNI